ncbi:uncharacterized protein PAC_10372 [Phialocephala subalpina]|uniref:Uncharacterized protein n=1 Tax=Phialocephala subalpina TaxID=576137 RepID=A0A1L7X615_9HELO|nr:uncharacterized protein PAC_10372 [Phialocephala subalpina]
MDGGAAIEDHHDERSDSEEDEIIEVHYRSDSERDPSADDGGEHDQEEAVVEVGSRCVKTPQTTQKAAEQNETGEQIIEAHNLSRANRKSRANYNDQAGFDDADGGEYKPKPPKRKRRSARGQATKEYVCFLNLPLGGSEAVSNLSGMVLDGRTPPLAATANSEHTLVTTETSDKPLVACLNSRKEGSDSWPFFL